MIQRELADFLGYSSPFRIIKMGKSFPFEEYKMGSNPTKRKPKRKRETKREYWVKVLFKSSKMDGEDNFYSEFNKTIDEQYPDLYDDDKM